MTDATQAVLEEALRLEPVERAALIEELYHTFGRSGDQRLDGLWGQEAESRVDGYEAGKITGDSAEAVLARINQR